MEFTNTKQVLNTIKASLSNLELDGEKIFKRVDIVMSETGVDTVLNALDSSIYPKCLILKEDAEYERKTTRLSYDRDLPIRILVLDKKIAQKKYDDTIYDNVYELEPLIIQDIVNISNDFSITSDAIFSNDIKNNTIIMELDFNYNTVVNFTK